jgi:hypothetical protein
MPGCVLVEWEGTVFGLDCGMDTAVCVVVEWEEEMWLVILWNRYSWLCIGKVERGTGDGLICGMYNAVCVVVDFEMGQGLF